MPVLRKQREWEPFIKWARTGGIVPFVGNQLVCPDYQEFIRKWAERVEYPFEDRLSIARVAQFYGATVNPQVANQQFIEFSQQNMQCPDFSVEQEHPLHLLAQLDLPLFVTTSHFDFVEKALESAGKKPRTEICYWNDELRLTKAKLTDQDYKARLHSVLVGAFSTDELKNVAFNLGIDYEDLPGQLRASTSSLARELLLYLSRRKRIPALVSELRRSRPDLELEEDIARLVEDTSGGQQRRAVRIPSVFDDDPNYHPNPNEPLVYHLFGFEEYPSSLVLSEDDHIDFLINVSKEPLTLNPEVTQYFTTNSQLLLGYQLRGWDFRILFRGVIASIPRSVDMNLSVQLDPMEDKNLAIKRVDSRADAQDYLERYLGTSNFWVYWGESGQFVCELLKRLVK